ALKTDGKAVEPAPTVVFDKGFKIDIGMFPGAVAFGLPVKVDAQATGAQTATVTASYMACKEGMCTPPLHTELPITFTVTAGPARPDHTSPVTAPPTQPAGYHVPASSGNGGTGGSAPADAASTRGAIQRAQSQGLLPFLLLSLSAGFLALLTPCV